MPVPAILARRPEGPSPKTMPGQRRKLPQHLGEGRAPLAGPGPDRSDQVFRQPHRLLSRKTVHYKLVYPTPLSQRRWEEFKVLGGPC
jgi:hypothetical protein